MRRLSTWISCSAGLVLFAALAAAPCPAHQVQPEQVIARLFAEGVDQGIGLVAVEQDARFSRLLVVRVGPGWARVDAARRRELAEQWWSLWRQSRPQGIVAVVDAATDRSLVRFDAHGRATLKSPTGPSARSAARGGARSTPR